jgi:hypothetical protein
MSGMGRVEAFEAGRAFGEAAMAKLLGEKTE